MENVDFFNLVINAVTVLAVLLFNKEGLSRIQKIRRLLENGGWRDCPRFIDQREDGKRWYDKKNLIQNEVIPITKEVRPL